MKNKIEFINDLKRQGALDIKEVVQWTNRLLPHFVPAQNRYKVADRVNVRIIRYYLNQGLISKPDGYKGRYSRFGANQVIQILAIKFLQAQYVPLKKIGQMISSVRESDLLTLLLENNPRDQSAAPATTAVKSMVDPFNSGYLPAKASIPEISDLEWQRFSIHEDIELLLRSGFNFLDHLPESGEIFSKIMQALANQMTASESRFVSKESSRPAKAIKDPLNTVIALVTEGGLVPIGNPDHLPPVRSENYMRYSLEGLNDLVAGQFESVDRGWDNTYVNSDPDRLLPLDVMRELEGQQLFNQLHNYFYSMTGAGTTIENARRIGRNIAREIRNKGVSAVIFTATCGTGTRCGAVISQEIEKAGIPTALITTLVPIAKFSGAYRIIPACGIDRPLGNPEQPLKEEKALRLKIVLKALEALETEVYSSSVFNWHDEGLDA